MTPGADVGVQGRALPQPQAPICRRAANAARRGALNALGAGLAAAPVLLATEGAARAQSVQQPQRKPLQNPRDADPKPPFADQSQPWPGLTAV